MHKTSKRRATARTATRLAGELVELRKPGHLMLHLCHTGARDTFARVRDLAEASRVLRQYVETAGFGASQMLPDFGDVVAAGCEVVAHVSYNGRVWAGERKRDQDDEILLLEAQ